MTTAMKHRNDIELAIHGGNPVIGELDSNVFHWPIVTDEDKQAVWSVIDAGNTSGTDITRRFEGAFCDYLNIRHALGHCNGTMALLAAMFGVGLGRGDEMLCPSLTYWASASPAVLLGATPVFVDVDPQTLCIDPRDIERHITERTKAIMVVHLHGHPCDMDAILPIAHRHGLKVIEDVSHAQGGLYRGRFCGTLGDVGAMSMMGAKSFAVGEGGMLVTKDTAIYERAIAFAHHERCTELANPALRHDVLDAAGHAAPLGGLKGRMNQMCSAMGIVQLKHYPERIAEIQRAMNRFWDLLEDIPGLTPHRTGLTDGSTMGGWYAPHGLYDPDALGGLPVGRFCEALRAEGIVGPGMGGFPGRYSPLHLHPVFNTADAFNDSRPTRNAFSNRDIRQPRGSLPVVESLPQRLVCVPWFKRDDPAAIEACVGAFRKVVSAAYTLHGS